MSQTARHRLEIELRRLELHRQENAAKSVPYISFILTHVSLVLFIIVTFFVDRLISDASTSFAVKIVVSIIAVLFLASEWLYAIVTSRRWKKNISIIHQLEEEMHLAEEQEQQQQQANVVAIAELKNRVLQSDLQRLRARGEIPIPAHFTKPQTFSSPLNH